VKNDIDELQEELEIISYRLTVLKNKIDEAMDLKQKVLRNLEILLVEKNICLTQKTNLQNRIKRLNKPSIVVQTTGEIA